MKEKKTIVYLVCSQLLNCSPVWRPDLLNDNEQVDRVERRATNHILGDYKLDYKEHLFAIGLLLLMYELEINDVMFCVKSLKSPAKDFR